DVDGALPEPEDLPLRSVPELEDAAVALERDRRVVVADQRLPDVRNREEAEERARAIDTPDRLVRDQERRSALGRFQGVRLLQTDRRERDLPPVSSLRPEPQPAAAQDPEIFPRVPDRRGGVEHRRSSGPFERTDAVSRDLVDPSGVVEEEDLTSRSRGEVPRNVTEGLA